MDASGGDDSRAEPRVALKELTGRIAEIVAQEGQPETARSQALSQVQHSGEPLVAALLAPFVERPVGDAKARDEAWQAMNGYLDALTGALSASARALVKEAASAAAAQRPAAAAAARALRAWRLRAKTCMVRYHAVPKGTWHTAYALHRAAEVVRCDGLDVQLHGSHLTTTTVTRELLRLAMLQIAMPEALAPAQIEIADWAVQQLGNDFLLWPRGAVDAAFFFDPGSDEPPRRAGGSEEEPAAARHFGAGPAHDALVQLSREVHDAKKIHVKTLRRDTMERWQAPAIQHLVAAWSDERPRDEPDLPPAEGTVDVVHGFSQCWQALSQRGGGLRLVDADEEPMVPPERWTLEASSGNQVVACTALADWMRCGELVVLDMGDGERSVGLIRSLRVDGDLNAHARMNVLSQAPQPIELQPAAGEGDAHASPAVAAIGFSGVRAILLADGESGSKPNLVLPPERWKAGSEFQWSEGSRALQLTRSLRIGDDYARMAFEWA
jgi:hypothetical protein